MRVGIVTLYNALNYGAFLQVYAMQEYLKSLGLEVDVLDCYTPSIRKYHYLITRPSRLPMRLKKHNIFKKTLKLLNVKRNKGQKYDLVLLGSDEIWNINNNAFIHLKEYFGQGINANRIIAYAPSCGYTKPEEIYENETYRNWIEKIDAVYARDNNTKIIAEKIFEKECSRVVDPTFLYLDNWKDETQKVEGIEKEDYIMYYGYSNNPYAKENMIKFAKENNLKLYSVGFENQWCDKSFIVNVKQFLYMVSKAKYVATTTFHGTIFCNIFKKNYVVFKANPKTLDVLDLIGLKESQHYEEHDSYESFCKILKTKPEYESAYQKLEEKIKESKEILTREIEQIK